MSPIYTFFQSEGIKENHRYEVNYNKNDTKIEKKLFISFCNMLLKCI